MRAHGIIFDLDGTLVDSIRDIAHAMNYVLERHGMPVHHVDDYRFIIGDGAEMLVRRALPPSARDQVDEMLSHFRLEYSERLLDTTEPYRGIPEMLEELRSLSVPIAVLSNKPQELTCRVIEALFPRIPFVRVYGHREGIPKKPAPGSALELMQIMDVAPNRCAMVGDSAIDMTTARNAGMIGIGVEWGLRPAAEMRSAGAEYILEDPSQLVPLTLEE